MADLKISALTASTTPLAGTEVLPIVQSSTTKQVSVANLTAGRAVSALSLTTTQGITGGSLYQVSGFSAYRADGATVSSPGDASMYFNSTTGQTFQARAGSSYDWSLINPGNANYIAQVPTGTLDFRIAGGNLVIGTSGKGIDFSATAGTGTSELLADYEEGTHTATITTGTSGTVSLLAGNTLLAYTKVGRLVTITGNIVADVVVLPIGYFDISLPFVVADLPELSGRSAATITMQSTVLSNISDFVSIMPETLSVIRVYLGNASTLQATSAQQIKQYTEMFISASYFTT